MIRGISLNFEIIGYKIIFYLLCLFAWLCRDIASPKFASIQNKKSDKSVKEDFFLFNIKGSWIYTIIFKPIITFPPSVYPFLNVINLVEHVMNIDSKIVL